MAFEDKSLVCAECGATFVFSAEEQSFFQSKGYTNEPKRCPSCREARRAQRYGSDNSARPSRQMFPVTCAECGKATEVPFEPREGRPVYCSECYNKIRPSR
ncbi:MAG: zinc-ribbon domain containing protein [Chloroflexota bacterium]